MNQRSPKTTSWRSVDAAYLNPDVSIQRTVQELWRASANDEHGLANSLGSKVLAQCVEIINNAQSAVDAAQRVRRLVALSGSSSLAADIAQRAIVLSFTNQNRIENFVRAVFTEASNYLVSRDLPGYVGVGSRLRTVTDIAVFKSSVISEVASHVDSVPYPTGNLGEHQTWNKFVDSVVSRLIEGQ